ncbi:hypothetical protein [Skermanella pratensis]|uniref:hypothetical protein n=1 Tax=Skermanella pratensis TaxID=2233999 RepID=UPI00178787C7|nr:hypothetical protein [Skermanella pratensis]
MTSVPAVAQTAVTLSDLPTAQLDQTTVDALRKAGIPDPTLALILNSRGELVGALVEDHPNSPAKGKPVKIPPGNLPKELKGLRGFNSLSILAYEGSNCYVIKRADGSLYLMPPGCTPG